MDVTYSDGTSGDLPDERRKDLLCARHQSAWSGRPRALPETTSTRPCRRDLRRREQTAAETLKHDDADLSSRQHRPFGNVGMETVTTEGVDLKDSITRTYLPPDTDTGSSRSSIRRRRPAAPRSRHAQMRILSRTYDPRRATFRPRRSRAAASPGRGVRLFLTRALLYDNFGNVRATRATTAPSATCAPPALLRRRRVLPARQPQCRRAHLTLMKYDPGLGVQTAFQDPNGLVTQWFYDGFGRRTEERRPDGTIDDLRPSPASARRALAPIRGRVYARHGRPRAARTTRPIRQSRSTRSDVLRSALCRPLAPRHRRGSFRRRVRRSATSRSLRAHLRDDARPAASPRSL